MATAATFSRVAYPEMRRYGYPQTFATGVIAAGGTLGIMIPPSTVFAVYGLITEQDIGKLFVAGILPGILAVVMYMVDHHRHRLRAAGLPAGGPRARLGGAARRHARRLGDAAAVRLRHRRHLRRPVHRRPKRPAWARPAPSSSASRAAAVARRTSCRSLLEATRTTAAVFTVLIGALLFGYFLTITQTPQKVTEFLTGLGIGRYGVLALIMVMYLVLGCLMDALAMIILTVPIIFPVIKQLGFDPIWFGVIIVMTVELGLIHPPVGHEHLRHQKRGRGREDLDDLLWRAAVHHHRYRAADHPDRLPDHRAVAAVEDVRSSAFIAGISRSLPRGLDGWIPGTSPGMTTP